MMNGFALWVLPIMVTMQLQLETYSARHPLLTPHDIIYMEQNVRGVKCPQGYFKCQSTPKCLIERLHCDGTVQCPDGSDERDCDLNDLDEFDKFDDAENLYWDHMFRKQPSGMNDDIPRGVCHIKGVNSSCACHSYDMLCDYRNLTSIPLDLPNSNMIMLDLSYNNFTHISSSFLNGMPNVTLEVLVIKFCEVSTIEPGAFKRARDLRLRTLYLSQNNLEHLDGPMFGAGNGLYDLLLSGNRISFLHVNAFLHLDVLEELDLRNNLIETFARKVFEPLKSVRRLYLCYNRLKHLRAGLFPPLPVGELSLVQNRIKVIGKKSFPFENLQYLYLDSNELTRLDDYSFCNVPQLKSLILPKNKLKHISVHAFDCIKRLMVLNLEENPLELVDQRAFQNLTNLNKVYFSKFQLCQAVPHVRKKCLPAGDGISSRKNLLENSMIRGCILFIIPVALLGNVFVFLWNLKTKTSRSDFGHTMYQNCLAFSEFLMGIYLAPIAFADIYSRDEFIKIAYQWTHGGICSVLGFMNTLSYQSSTFLVMLITWERLMSVTKLLQNRDTRPKTIVIHIVILYSISIALAAIPFTHLEYFGMNFYETNALCLPLSIEYPYGKAWEYSALLFLGTTALALAFIIVCYIRIFIVLRYTPVGLRRLRSGREKAMSRRFTEMLFMNILCWLSVLAYILYDYKAKPYNYPWVALVVIPFKSAWNPFAYLKVTVIRREHLTHPEEPVIADIRLMERPRRTTTEQLNTAPGTSASASASASASTSGITTKKRTTKNAKKRSQETPQWVTEF